ncbi:hypothetical protein PM082_024801 [Marasmius tenuissimus]|nr:hypothetical protein PM082_024801 [Marasmius tenuissimus]
MSFIHPLRGSERSMRDGFNTMIVGPLLFTSVHLFLYGLYVLLYRIGLLVLRERPRTRERLLHQVSLHVLFLLVTINVPLALAYDLLQIFVKFSIYSGLDVSVGVDRAQRILEIFRIVVLFTQSTVTDTVLIFRCYVLWKYRYRRYVFIPVMFCAILDVTVGGASAGIATQLVAPDEKMSMQQVCNTFLALIAFSNIVLTGTIAYRVWTTMRATESALHPDMKRRFSIVIAIVLESGLLYVLTIVFLISVGTFAIEKPWDIASIMIQISGIAPTLVIVRANTRQRVHNRPMLGGKGKGFDSELPVEQDIAVKSVAKFAV